MTRQISTEPLSKGQFAAFGDVLDATGAPDRLINQGLCGRFHDRARLDFGSAGRAGISIFHSDSFTFPVELTLVERHPEGSQAFLPMHQNPFLVVVAPDLDGIPGTPRAFLTNGAQGINLHRGVWHGVLTPLADPGLFAIVDRIGTTANLQEHTFQSPFTIVMGNSPA